MRVRTWFAAGTAGAALAAAPILVVARSRPAEGDDGASGQRARTALAKVERRTLTDRTDVDGTLGYGERRPVVNRLPGTVTWTADEGSVVERGGKLFEVDGRAVPLLYGGRPAYRDLAVGAEGDDVLTLEQNLAALGYAPGTVDDDYTSATATAVAAWQEDLGVAETGRVGLGEVVVLPAAVRVADISAEPGAPVTPGQSVLDVTGTTRVVTVDLDAGLQQYVKQGTAVTVELPGGKTAKATVTEVGRVVTVAAGEGQNGESDPTIAVVVTLADEQAAGTLDEAPVTVELTTLERKNVLAVPVSALLALAEGGYAVELPDGTLTAVTPGRFADGYVEITGDAVREGTQVVVPR